MKKALYLPIILLMFLSLISCQKSRMNADLESISGPTWKLTHFEGKRVKENVFSISLPIIKFMKDGKFSGSTGCNEYWSSIIITDTKMEVSCISQIKVGCSGHVGEVEQAMVQGLYNSNQLFLEGNSLVFKKDNKVLLKFEK